MVIVATMLQSALSSWILEPEILPSLIAVFPLKCLVLSILALLLLLYRPYNRHPASLYKDNNPPQLRRPAGEIITSFFENQFDFIRNGFKETSSSVFQFKLNRHNVIALSGEEGRRTFFKEKGLDLYEGFQVIVGTVWYFLSYFPLLMHSLISLSLARFLPALIQINFTAYINGLVICNGPITCNTVCFLLNLQLDTEKLIGVTSISLAIV